jgi:hypothetical protein
MLDNAQRTVQVENLDIHKRSTFYFDDGSVTLKVGVYHGLDRALNLRISGRGRVFPGPRPHLPARVRRGKSSGWASASSRTRQCRLLRRRGSMRPRTVSRRRILQVWLFTLVGMPRTHARAGSARNLHSPPKKNRPRAVHPLGFPAHPRSRHRRAVRPDVGGRQDRARCAIHHSRVAPAGVSGSLRAARVADGRGLPAAGVRRADPPRPRARGAPLWRGAGITCRAERDRRALPPKQ